MSWTLFLALLFATGFEFTFAGPCVSSLWVYNNNACYYFAPGKANYADAKASCAAMAPGARLVTIHSAVEQNFLNLQYGNKKYWLGLEWISGLWKWLDNAIFIYSNWYSAPSTTQCPMVTHLGGLGRWSTVPCSERSLDQQGTLCKYYVTATATTTKAPTTAAKCVDNAATGNPSDCPLLAYLCNDKTYYDLLTHECPYTCNRCPGQARACNDSVLPNGTTDCPQKSYLCTDKNYWDYMTQQCPRTCNRCPPRGTCYDRVASNGVSECPAKSYLCFFTGYVDFMRIECPRTCGYCV